MSPRTGTRWVTFDGFGTLVDWEGAFASALDPLAGGRAWDVVRAYQAHERTVLRDRPHRSYRDVLATTLVRAAVECGVPLPAAGVHTLARSWGAMRPFGDVEPMLAELRQAKFRLAVLANCDDDLFELTHRTFRAPFDLFLTSERVRAYKPALWHFRAFERLTGVSKDEWVHVGASRYHDIEPAAAFGVRSIWLDRGDAAEGERLSPDRVSSASGVAHALEGLFARNGHAWVEAGMGAGG